MTREEQLDWLYRLRSEIYVYMPKEWLIPMNNALDMTIKAIEQEPYEDCISRQAVINGIDNYIEKVQSTGAKDDFISFEELVVKALPSVKPQEPFINKPCIAHQVCHEDKVKVIEKIRAEIERQENWLLQAGCTTYNVDIAFDSIKSVLTESEDRYDTVNRYYDKLLKCDEYRIDIVRLFEEK